MGRMDYEAGKAIPGRLQYTLGMTQTTSQDDGPERPAEPPAAAALPDSERFVDPKWIGVDDPATVALLVRVNVLDQPGVLHALTRVITDHQANITYVSISDSRIERPATYFELSGVDDPDGLVHDLEELPIVREVERAPSFGRVFGKRIIVIGGGAQVGQVVVGAVSEADRQNIRGERISVDTIPLVGEENLAGAVRAVARLPSGGGAGAGRLDHGRRRGAGRSRDPHAGHHRRVAQHGGQCARRRRSGGDRSGPGRRHDRDGRRPHREVRHPPPAWAPLLSICHPDPSASLGVNSASLLLPCVIPTAASPFGFAQGKPCERSGRILGPGISLAEIPRLRSCLGFARASASLVPRLRSCLGFARSPGFASPRYARDDRSEVASLLASGRQRKNGRPSRSRTNQGGSPTIAAQRSQR